MNRYGVLGALAGVVNPPGPYMLHVRPEMAPEAELILQEEFGSDWRAHLVIDDRLPVDEWYVVYPNVNT